MTLKVGYKKLLQEANGQIKAVAIDQAQSLLDQDDALFVDIRDIRELHRNGTIPGSLHAPRGMLEFWVDPESPYHKEIFATKKTFILFCESGWRSALATKTLQDMGLAPVCHLTGGHSAWREAGLPTIAHARQKT